MTAAEREDAAEEAAVRAGRDAEWWGGADYYRDLNAQAAEHGAAMYSEALDAYDRDGGED